MNAYLDLLRTRGVGRLLAAQLVARDVREGYVSRGVALSAYRVVLDGSGAVDEAATRALRARTDIAPSVPVGQESDQGPQFDMTPG